MERERLQVEAGFTGLSIVGIRIYRIRGFAGLNKEIWKGDGSELNYCYLQV
jgi:hypothetical protein